MVRVESHGAGPDLVLLHGWGMHGGVWGEFVPRLSAFARVYVVDLPGHGHSALCTPYTVASLTEAILDAVPEQAMWLGWSLGGMLALQAAATRPQRVTRLGLMASSPCFMQQPDWLCAMPEVVLQQFVDRLQADIAATVQQFLALQALGSPEARRQVQQLRHSLHERPLASAEALAAGLQLLRDSDLRPLLPAVKQPTVLLYGERDTLVPIGAAHWLQTQLPQARSLLLPQSAHAPFLTHGRECAALIREVLYA